MRLLGDVSQVIVEATGARIRPLGNVLQCLAALRLRLELEDAAKLFLEPGAVVKRVIQRVQACPAGHADGLVKVHTKLHSDALEQRLGQLEDPYAPQIGRASC